MELLEFKKTLKNYFFFHVFGTQGLPKSVKMAPKTVQDASQNGANNKSRNWKFSLHFFRSWKPSRAILGAILTVLGKPWVSQTLEKPQVFFKWRFSVFGTIYHQFWTLFCPILDPKIKGQILPLAPDGPRKPQNWPRWPKMVHKRSKMTKTNTFWKTLKNPLLFLRFWGPEASPRETKWDRKSVV